MDLINGFHAKANCYMIIRARENSLQQFVKTGNKVAKQTEGFPVTPLNVFWDDLWSKWSIISPLLKKHEGIFFFFMKNLTWCTCWFSWVNVLQTWHTAGVDLSRRKLNVYMLHPGNNLPTEWWASPDVALVSKVHPREKLWQLQCGLKS